MNLCSTNLKKLVGHYLAFVLVAFPIVSLINANATTVNVCVDGENNLNNSETEFWIDFATTFNISYGSSSQELNCSSFQDKDMKELHTIPYNLSETSSKAYLEFASQENAPENYCIANISETEITIQLCSKKKTWEQECPANKTCIRKCCQPNAIFIHEENDGFRCINSSSVWKPIIYQSESNKSNEDANISLENALDIDFISSHPKEGWCEFGPFVLETMEFEGTKYSIRILENGDVIARNHGLQPWRLLQPGTFCIDGILRNGSDIVDYENNVVIVDCSPPDDYEEEQVNQMLYIIFRSVACCFLVLTVFVYLVLWERQNIHSWTLLAYAISMLFLHISIFATYLHNDQIDLDEGPNLNVACKSLGILSHFLYLSTFCWLTLINFDVYWTFKNLTLTTGRSKRKRRFLYYFLFAFLLPSAVILFGFLLKHIFQLNDEGEIIYLEYSLLHCFISDFSALYFKFIPVATLLGCNLILFTMTVITLHKIGESTKFATNKSSQSDTEKSKVLLFVKLFFVMGLIWMLELVSYFVFGRESTHSIAYVLDVINILQPIAIFIIFVCKADIFRGLQVKLPCLRQLFTMLGLQYLRTRIGSGLSSASVATQISTTSIRSNNGGDNSRNQVSFELK